MDGIDVSRGGDMEFLRGSTDSQWSCLYIHLLVSAVRQFITKDMAVRSKLAAWIWASQAQWDDTHRETLSLSLSLSLSLVYLASCTKNVRDLQTRG